MKALLIATAVIAAGTGLALAVWCLACLRTGRAPVRTMVKHDLHIVGKRIAR